MSYTLQDKPRSVGDLVGLGFRLFRYKWKLILQKLITPSLAMSVSISALEACFVNWVKAQSLDVGWFVIHIAIALVLTVILLASLWEIALRSCALVRIFMDEESEFAESYEFARERQWAILAVYGLSFLVPFLVCVVWIVLAALTMLLVRFGPLIQIVMAILGLIEVITFFLAFGFSLVYTGMCFVSVSQKARSIKEALAEGYRLTLTNMSRGLGFVGLLACSIYLFSFIFYVPVAILMIFEGYSNGFTPDPEYSIYVKAIDAITATVVNVLSVGIGLAGLCFYYWDLKIRVFGEDIKREIEKRAS